MEVVGVCRCCLAQGPHKDLHTSYFWIDRREVYSEMLKECFNINLMPSDQKSCGICDSCINSLRNSVNFKHQVLTAEENFLKRINDGIDKDEKPFEVKLEPKMDSSDDSDDYYLADADPGKPQGTSSGRCASQPTR